MRSPQRFAPTESDLQNKTLWKGSCDSELIPTEQRDRSIGKVQSILAQVKKLWQNAIAPSAEEAELRIWQEKDRQGRLHWHVFDPSTGKSVSCASELEMLSWIENLNHLDRW
jgi:hypothetical protein